MRMRWLIPALAMAILVAGKAEPRPRLDDQGPGGIRGEVIQLSAHSDVNEIDMFVTNQGSWAFDQAIGDAGLEWPKGSGNHAVFAGGLWLGARVNNQVRVTVGEFSQEYAAGPIGPIPGCPAGQACDPTETDPRWDVLKLNAGDDATSNPDYTAWQNMATLLGADGPPVDSTGAPIILGDQTLWCVYNDAVLGKHTNNAGNSQPLGVEVRQTTFAFQRTGALGKTVFIDLEIENKGSNVLQDMYISIWYDPDLGGFTDDLVGCDTTLSLGYVYNATNNDGQYGANCPTMGCDFFLGPVTQAGDTLGMASFNKYINGTDPASSQETYNYMQGLDLSGAPQDCNGVPTTFVLTGDPVAGTSCLDTDPADRRFMMSSGPIVMNPGDEQRVVVAIIIGGESGKGDRLSNISLLKFYDQFAQDAFDRNFDIPSPPPQPAVLVTPGDGAVNLSWGSESQTNYDEPGYFFEGYNVYQGASASGPWQLVRRSGGPPFDVVNGIGIIFEDIFDSESGVIINSPVQFGSDAGVKHSIDITEDFIRGGPLHNASTYYYAVTAYSFGPAATPNNLENAIVPIPVEPQREVAGVDLSGVQTGAVSYSVAISDTIPPATNVVTVETIQPSRITGHTYKVVFTPVTPFDVSIDGTIHTVNYVWNVVDISVSPPDTVLANQFNLTGNDDYLVVDGVRVKVQGVYFPQIQDIAYQNVGPNARALTGVDWGGRFFFGGADTGCRWSGSTFTDSPDDALDFCPAAEVNPDLFYSVDLRFGSSGKAYLFHRQELLDGSSPTGDPDTRPYIYDGYVDVPFTVHDLLNNRQLQAMISEREVVDAGGTPLPPNLQPHPTYDGTWKPDVADSLGGREYINVLSATYSDAPDPQFEQDNIMFSGTIPVIYGFWVALRDSSRVIDPGDFIHVTWGNPADENDVYTFSTIAGVGVAAGQVAGDPALARARGDLKQIRVVPNPYLTRSSYEQNQFNRKLKFINLPAQCTIRIFSLAGDLVRTLPAKNDPSTSIQEWDLENQFGLPVGSGIYVYHVDAPGIGTTFGKLAVVMEKENLENF